jgi:ubiquinone/menaquinone biosynthesis C-methylase UbiE
MSKEYTLSAKYYDALYTWKDYKKESRKLIKLIKKNKKTNGKELLEVGCGTGKYLEHLKNQFHCVGVDYSADMLKVARKKHPKMELKQMDMTTLKLGKKFDVIICLFSSIGYVKTQKRLKQTIRGFARHLKKGGVLIIEPWFAKGQYHAGNPHGTFYKSKDLVVARVTVSEQRGNVSVMDMYHLIGEKGKKVKVVVEHHELGLFSIPQTLDILKKSGLAARFDKNGLADDRGIYIATKPLA